MTCLYRLNGKHSFERQARGGALYFRMFRVGSDQIDILQQSLGQPFDRPSPGGYMVNCVGSDWKEATTGCRQFQPPLIFEVNEKDNTARCSCDWTLGLLRRKHVETQARPAWPGTLARFARQPDKSRAIR